MGIETFVILLDCERSLIFVLNYGVSVNLGSYNKVP